MKAFFLLFAAMLPAVACPQDKVPTRRLGTNIFDFGPLMQSVQRGEITNSPYLVIGKVVEVTGNGIQIIRREPILTARKGANNHLSEDFMREMLLAGPEKQLKYLFISKKLIQQQQVSSGEFMSWDSEMRQIYYDEKQREQEIYDTERQHSEDSYIYRQIFVNNCPPDFAIHGKQVCLFALPVGTYTFTNTANGSQSMPRFDYGQPYFEDVSNIAVFLITKNGITRKQTIQEIATKKGAITERLLVWQFEQASNGMSYAQYDVAQRYFKGDGVTKNDSLGRYWLQLSASQNYDPAINLLKTLEH
jgi:hypothetical protein